MEVRGSDAHGFEASSGLHDYRRPLCLAALSPCTNSAFDSLIRPVVQFVAELPNLLSPFTSSS